MDSSKLLIVGGVVLGGFYLLNKGKKTKADADTKALADAQAQALALAMATPTIPNPVVVESKFYTPAEATKKALEVVTKWISLLDAIPKEALTEENKNILNQKAWDEKAKKDKAEYDKALALAKSKNEPKFTFGDTNYWTANEEDVRNGSWVKVLSANVWQPNNIISYSNSFKIRDGDRMFEISRANLMFSNAPKNLGDYVKRVKQIDFSNVYDALKVQFAELPKTDVDRLVILLPKYLLVVNDDFKYFENYLQQNPFTIEEQLYLKDVSIDSLFNPKKTVTPQFYGNPIIQNATSFANAVQNATSIANAVR
jgi:hypothetical protein